MASTSALASHATAPCGSKGEARSKYTRREPDKTVLYQIVQANLEPFLRYTAKVATRVTRMLRRRGLIGEARHDTNETAPIDKAIDGCRLAGLSRGRFEKIDKHGRGQQRLFPDDDVRFARRNNGAWAANVEGFSVEAGVYFGALDRKGRERLVRYCLRPPIATERFSILGDGSIAYLTKYPRGRATHRVMSGIECMARLAALVPPPRSALWRYHGVLASASPWCSRVVPHKPVTSLAVARSQRRSTEIPEFRIELEAHVVPLGLGSLKVLRRLARTSLSAYVREARCCPLPKAFPAG